MTGLWILPRVARRLRPLTLVVFLAGCSQMRPPPGLPLGAVDGVGVVPARTLYRVRYDGPSGDGSLRLVLRQVAADRFQLQASDTFGRAAWSLDVDGDDVLMVNHREHWVCLAGSELRVPEVALRPLPLEAVPRVLNGRTPLAPPAGVADESDWTDDEGQRWTVRREDGELAAWTLWQAGEPRLWWLRQPRGGLLSHREGSQFRWRRVAREELLPESYRRVERPPDYAVEECEG